MSFMDRLSCANEHHCDNVFVQHVGSWPDYRQLGIVAEMEREALPGLQEYKHSEGKGLSMGLIMNHTPGQHWFLASITHKDLTTNHAVVHGYACVVEKADQTLRLEELVVRAQFKPALRDAIARCMLQYVRSCFHDKALVIPTDPHVHPVAE